MILKWAKSHQLTASVLNLSINCLNSNVNVESIHGESFEDEFLYDTVLFKDVKEAQQNSSFC